MNTKGPSIKTVILVFVLCLSILAIAYFMLFTDNGSEKSDQQGDVFAQPKSVTVRLTPLGFEPSSIIVDKDTVVTFVNKSNTPYWIVSSSSNPLDGFGSGVINSGQSYSFVYSDVGEWPYLEQTYNKFNGTVIVADTR